MRRVYAWHPLHSFIYTVRSQELLYLAAAVCCWYRPPCTRLALYIVLPIKQFDKFSVLLPH